jgi:hypothetical protein
MLLILISHCIIQRHLVASAAYGYYSLQKINMLLLCRQQILGDLTRRSVQNGLFHVFYTLHEPEAGLLDCHILLQPFSCCQQTNSLCVMEETVYILYS